MIYLDNAATSLLRPDCVLDAVSKAMLTLGNPGRGAHKPSLDAARSLYSARISAAKLFGNIAPSSIAFTANATESLNAAIFGILDYNCGVITTMTEHNSVLRPLYRMRDMGAEISFIPSSKDGTINISCADELVTENTRAVVLNHISNVTGEIADLEFFSEFCKRHHLLLILDCAQSAGHIPININDYNIDVCCFTGHKGLLGPQGTGGIYIRPGLEIHPFKSGGSGAHSFDEYQPAQMPDVLEAGTSNSHGIAGLKAGIDYLLDHGIQNVYNKTTAVCHEFTSRIKNIPNVKIYGGNWFIVSLNIDGFTAAETAQILWERYEIAVRSGAHCAPLIHKALGVSETVRFSFGISNSLSDAVTAAKAVEEIASLQ